MKPLRTCRKCGLQAFTDVDLANFVKNKNSKNGHLNICKYCYNKSRKSYTRKQELIERVGTRPPCYFCGKEITKLEGLDVDSLVFHSLDGNHDNWEPENKVPAHHRCHTLHHKKSKNPMGKGDTIYKPKITPEQRIIIVHALRAYLIGLVKELDGKRPIGPEQKEEADEIEACFMLYRRFKTRKIGRAYPYWWKTTYDSRLTEIYYELKEDIRQEDREEVKP